MAAKKKVAKKKVVVDESFLEENPELLEEGLEVGDEVEVEEEAPKKSKAGVKYEIWDNNGYIRTYDDKKVAEGFAGKVSSRRIVEV